jgi:hypothetical protein
MSKLIINEKIAEKYNITPEEVRREMQDLIILIRLCRKYLWET